MAVHKNAQEKNLGKRLGANLDILSANAPVQILNISWNVHTSQKVFQVHCLQYQTYSSGTQYNSCMQTKPHGSESMKIVTVLPLLSQDGCAWQLQKPLFEVGYSKL